MSVPTPSQTVGPFFGVGLGRVDAGGTMRVEGQVLDRKSTRLNSSHLVISYAVFCLNKNKQRALELALGAAGVVAPIVLYSAVADRVRRRPTSLTPDTALQLARASILGTRQPPGSAL